jgi:VWFA-related protein
VFSLAVVLSTASLVTGAAAGPADPDGVVRTVYVTAVDSNGVPVSDLTATDFEVKEDGKVRQVMTAETAAAPLSVAVLVDDNGTDINEIRAALAGFAQRLQGRAEIAIVSVVPSPLKVVDYTTDIPTLLQGIGRLVWRAAPSGGHLLGSIVESAAELKRREADRPTIVVLTFERVDFSSSVPAAKVLDHLGQGGPRLFVVAVGRAPMKGMKPFTDGPQGDDWVTDNTHRVKVLGEGWKQSGGRRHDVAAATGLVRVMGQLAEELPHQYAVVYSGSEDARSGRKLGVSVKRRGVTVRAPTRSAAR